MDEMAVCTYTSEVASRGPKTGSNYAGPLPEGCHGVILQTLLKSCDFFDCQILLANGSLVLRACLAALSASKSTSTMTSLFRLGQLLKGKRARIPLSNNSTSPFG